MTGREWLNVLVFTVACFLGNLIGSITTRLWQRKHPNHQDKDPFKGPASSHVDAMDWPMYRQTCFEIRDQLIARKVDGAMVENWIRKLGLKLVMEAMEHIEGLKAAFSLRKPYEEVMLDYLFKHVHDHTLIK